MDKPTMKIAIVALILVLGAAIVLWFSDSLNSWGLGILIAGPLILLLSIPISLSIFTFLSHRQQEEDSSQK